MANVKNIAIRATMPWDGGVGRGVDKLIDAIRAGDPPPDVFDAAHRVLVELGRCALPAWGLKVHVVGSQSDPLMVHVYLHGHEAISNDAYRQILQDFETVGEVQSASCYDTEADEHIEPHVS